MTVPPDARDAAFAFAGSNDWTRAVPEARRALAANPEDASAHALLALGLAHQKDGHAAVEAGQRAVALEPEEPFAHYALGVASYQHDDVGGAERAAREALRLDPDASYYALLGQVLVRRRHWKEALQAAADGLQLEPDHAGCASVRALALTGLGRSDEAAGVLRESLAQDPDDAFAHAQRGWLLLRQSQVDDALDAFRTALRLEPDNDYARSGIVEALKARNPVYRFVLRYVMWIATFDARTQWMIIIGLFVGSRIVRSLMREYPAWAPVLGPVMAIYVVFVFSTWLAEPISNLLLRLNEFGRLTLTRAQITGSNLTGGCLATCVAAALLYMATGTQGWLLLTGASFLMLLPVAGLFSGHGTRAWTPLLIVTSLLALCGLTAVVLAFLGQETGAVALGIMAVGVFFNQWFVNYLLMKYA